MFESLPPFVTGATLGCFASAMIVGSMKNVHINELRRQVRIAERLTDRELRKSYDLGLAEGRRGRSVRGAVDSRPASRSSHTSSPSTSSADTTMAAGIAASSPSCGGGSSSSGGGCDGGGI